MEIIKTINGSQAVLALSGRLDAKTSSELQAAIDQMPNDISDLTFDLEKLVYLSSAGLRVIQAVRKRLSTQAGALKLIKVQPVVMEIFEATGFASILNIEK